MASNTLQSSAYCGPYLLGQRDVVIALYDQSASDKPELAYLARRLRTRDHHLPPHAPDPGPGYYSMQQVIIGDEYRPGKKTDGHEEILAVVTV